MLCLCADNEKLTATTQTEPVPTLIDRMPVDVPADAQNVVGIETGDPSAIEVPLTDQS